MGLAAPRRSDPIAKTELRDGAIERVTGAIGRELFEFVVARPLEEFPLESPTPEAVCVAITKMDDLLLSLHEGESNLEFWGQVLRARLTDTAQADPPLALVMRQSCDGSIDVVQVEDEAERLLADLAVRVYPAWLLPSDPSVPEMPRWFGREPHRVGQALFRDPRNKDLEAAMLADPVFKKAFQHESESTGYVAVVYCSTGCRGSVQLWGLPGQIFAAAWRTPSPALPEFVDAVLQRYRLVRGALGGKALTVDAQVSLAGVRLPSGAEYDFGDVQLRAATLSDHEIAPELLSGSVVMTDESGIATKINYAGDVVAELKVPYEVRLSNPGLDDQPMEFPPDLIAKDPIPDLVMRLRASLLLAAERTPRAQVGMGWRQVDDLLHRGGFMSWSEPQRLVGLRPSTLTSSEVEAWRDWYLLISTPEAEQIHLALTRIVRASGERPDPVDVLVDSVIAWENMFGASDGETTFRVTASLAILLEPDPDRREALRKELVAVYRLRSKAVHGTSMPTSPRDTAMCFRALDVAIQAIRVVVRDRPDLLGERNVSSRGNKLILGVQRTEDKSE